MKNIIKFFNRGLLFAIATGGASLGLTVSLHAEVGDANVIPISSGYSLNAVECTEESNHHHRYIIDCKSLNKIVLNEFATETGWELNTAKLFAYASDVDESNSIKSLKVSPVNGAPVVLSAQPSSQEITDAPPASVTSLSLQESIRGNVDNTGDSTISEPLLTSILALIAIVAVARRNVSGG